MRVRIDLTDFRKQWPHGFAPARKSSPSPRSSSPGREMTRAHLTADREPSPGRSSLSPEMTYARAKEKEKERERTRGHFFFPCAPGEVRACTYLRAEKRVISAHHRVRSSRHLGRERNAAGSRQPPRDATTDSAILAISGRPRRKGCAARKERFEVYARERWPP